MTENPTPPTDPVQPSPADPASESQFPAPSRARGLTLGIAVSWLLIVATIVISQIPQFRKQQPTQEGIEQDASLQLMGRYIIGMRNFLGSAPVLESSMPQLVQALEASDNPRKHLFFLPVQMELTASDKVITELERLAKNPEDDPVARDASLFLQLYRNGSESLTPAQTEIIKQYGWIGKLALSHDKPDSDPMRKSVMNSAMRTFIVSIVSVFAVSTALVAGSIAFIVALVLWKKNRLHGRYRSLENPGNSLLEAFALSIAGLIALPGLAKWLSPHVEMVAALFSLPIIILALFWPCIRGAKWKDVRGAIGWHCGQGFFREMGAGIVGYLAGLPLLAIAFIPVLILTRSTGNVPSHPIANEINRDPFTLLIIMGLACIWAPIIEETFFRGMFFGYLRRRWHWVATSIITGFVFAIIHPQGWVAVPLLGTIGFTLSAIREWRGSIIAPMTAHALNNGAVLLLAILMLT